MSAVERPTDGPDSGEPDLCAALQASLDRARGRRPDDELTDEQLMADMDAADRGEDWRR